jgi:hypothetical protein
VREAAESWRKEQEQLRIGKSKEVDDQQSQGPGSWFKSRYER